MFMSMFVFKLLLHEHEVAQELCFAAFTTLTVIPRLQFLQKQCDSSELRICTETAFSDQVMLLRVPVAPSPRHAV